MNSRVIYHASQSDFFEDCLMNRVASVMHDNAMSLGIRNSDSEISSWQNNAPRIKQLLELSHVSDSYVTFEYLVPYNLKRIDCMIYGHGSNDRPNVVHLELKQWSNDGVKTARSDGNFEIEGDEETNYRVEAYTGGGYRVVAHPSQQVKGYHGYLKGFVESIAADEIGLEGYAYCYNYERRRNPVPALYDSKYNKLQQEFRTFAGDEVGELASIVADALRNGKGFDVFNKMMHSGIRPSKKLLESASRIVHDGDTDTFSLIDDQIVARNVILDKIRNPRRKKSVVIVKGGPGTGKTVIALNILAELASSGKNLNVQFATKSKPLLEGVKSRLPRGSRAKILFQTLSHYVPATCPENGIDVLLVDESHRIAKSANNQFTPSSMRTDLPQVDTVVRAAKNVVFFIDDRQAIRSMEIGSVEMIKECARRYGADIEEVELKSQFRCNGSNNYLDWLEYMLYDGDGRGEKPTFSEDEFDFRIFDSPATLYQAISDKNSIPGMTARLCAGFCWPWSDNLAPDGDLVKDVKIGDEFAMPWETKDTIPHVPDGYVKWYEWAYKPEGIKQVGCIYTAQGFEFDYVGVIVGKDLKFDPASGKLVTDYSETKDPTLRRSRQGFDAYVRNIYRVLMSRGMKGCYVYFCDPEVKQYFMQ